METKSNFPHPKRGDREKGFYIRQIGSSESAGPMCQADLVKAIKFGGVKGNDFVRRSDSENWHRVDSISELKKLMRCTEVVNKPKSKKYSTKRILLTIVAIWITLIFISSILVILSDVGSTNSATVAKQDDRPSGPRVEHLVAEVRKYAGPWFNYLETKLENKIDISLSGGQDGVVCQFLGDQKYKFSIRVYFQLKNYEAGKTEGVATWNEVVPKRINMLFLVSSTPEQKLPKMVLVPNSCSEEVVQHNNYVASQFARYSKYFLEQSELSGMGLVQRPVLTDQLDAMSDCQDVKQSADGFFEFVNLVFENPYWVRVYFEDWEL
jgi:hypothetical protein